MESDAKVNTFPDTLCTRRTPEGGLCDGTASYLIEYWEPHQWSEYVCQFHYEEDLDENH
jgi:hypothetical protein